jgi:hypothetical protein
VRVTQAAAILLWFSAIGLAIPGLIGIKSLLEGRGIATVLGYPSYGGGPFEQHGLPSTVPLLLAFLVVCVIDFVAGVLLWQGLRSGAVLALIALPLGGLFWWGFALPYPPVIALVRTLLIALSWESLH